jgi:hypothetical protein
VFTILFFLICYILILTVPPLFCSDHVAHDDVVFAERAATPQAARVEEPVEEVAQMSAEEVVEELAVVTARQAELVTRLKAQAVRGVALLRRMSGLPCSRRNWLGRGQRRWLLRSIPRR